MATTITAPKLWKPGDGLNAANLNAELRDQVNGLLGGPYVHVTQSAGQTLVTATETLITWDTETEDSDSMHDNVTNNSRLVAPIAGLYLVRANISWVAAAANTMRYLRLRANLKGVVTQVAEVTMQSNAANPSIHIEKNVRLSALDYVEVTAAQYSGGNLATVLTVNSPFFEMMWERV